LLKNRKIALVIPAFNEEVLIEKTLLALPSYVDYIIVVDDCSNDRTIEMIERISNLNVILIRHDNNYGVGKAISTGYKYSLTLDSSIVCVMAADDQMCPNDLISVISPVLEVKANYCKGNRFMDSNIFKEMPRLRLIGNFCFSIMSCIASGYYNIFDTQCGFTAIDKETLEKLDLDKLFPGYGFPTDMLARLSMIQAKVLDVPVKAIYRNEKSGIKPVYYTFTIIYLMIKLFLMRQINRLKRINLSNLFTSCLDRA
jgi:glycosyltransferase involved in cell wall biosynthesis